MARDRGFGPRNELDDFGAHESPSHTAIATRPANASEIRYAVIGSLSEMNEMCGMIAWRDHFRREPYPWSYGAACGRGISATPRTGTFARAG